MAKQRMKKMVITVTPQTAYHLRDMAATCKYKSVGRVVDKLVREKRISMNEWKREGGGMEEKRMKDRFFCRKNWVCFEACSECGVYGECFMCASIGDHEKCTKCTRYYEGALKDNGEE